MPTEDYIPATSGTLKLKGVQNSKISKKKKRPKPPQPSSSNQDPTTLPPTAGELTADKNGSDVGSELEKLDEKGHDDGVVEKEEISLHGRGKTEAQIRHEERRRKRLDERLKREGTKTHKERVEELNRYLSNLSEHHDMPRIGPG